MVRVKRGNVARKRRKRFYLLQAVIEVRIQFYLEWQINK
jgi:ribosomal protein L20